VYSVTRSSSCNAGRAQAIHQTEVTRKDLMAYLSLHSVLLSFPNNFV